MSKIAWKDTSFKKTIIKIGYRKKILYNKRQFDLIISGNKKKLLENYVVCENDAGYVAVGHRIDWFNCNLSYTIKRMRTVT